MDAQKTGALIAQARREKGMTQKELAQALHVSAQAVSKWERGLNFPDLPLLEPLGERLGLTVSELLAGARGEKPGEELLRDSLRALPVQMGRRLKRWQVLALSCLGVLLALALGAGYWYVKYHTQLLPQPVTTIAPLERSEGEQLAFQTAGLPSVYLYELTVADGTEHYQVQMEYWTSEGLMRTWPVLECGAEDLPRRQQMAFACGTRAGEDVMEVGLHLAEWSRQYTIEDVPNLERGYGMRALNTGCQLSPEHGAVLACFSLAMDASPAGREGLSYRAPAWLGAVEEPDLGAGESCLLLRLLVQ